MRKVEWLCIGRWCCGCANSGGRDWDVVLELFELGAPIVFRVRDADSCGSDIEVAVLMVASLWWLGVEL